MIDYNAFRFGAAPYTGELWVMRAARHVGCTPDGGSVWDPPICDDPSKLTVTLVRHPCEWLRCYYHFATQPLNLPLIDVLLPLAKRSWTFEEFAARYLDEVPGQYNRIVESYRGDSAIRFEDLTWGIIELFQAVGGVDGVKAIELKNLPWIEHEDEVQPLSSSVAPYWQDRVKRAEKTLYEQFDYGRNGDQT